MLQNIIDEGPKFNRTSLNFSTDSLNSSSIAAHPALYEKYFFSERTDLKLSYNFIHFINFRPIEKDADRFKICLINIFLFFLFRYNVSLFKYNYNSQRKLIKGDLSAFKGFSITIKHIIYKT